MKLATQMVSLAFFAVLLGSCSAYSVNPCPSLRDPYCNKPEVCAAVGYFTRKAKCVSAPPPNPACICPAVFDPVCCRLREHRPRSTINLTKGNSCQCGCLGGKELFKGSCENPPTKAVPCTKELNPTCCYLRQFDVTFVASNPCLCTKARFGKIVSGSICKLH